MLTRPTATEGKPQIPINEANRLVAKFSRLYAEATPEDPYRVISTRSKSASRTIAFASTKETRLGAASLPNAREPQNGHQAAEPRHAPEPL